MALGERTRDAMSHKCTNGERVGNIQFGFRLGTDGKHVEPDPRERKCLTKSAACAKWDTLCAQSLPR